MTALLLLSFVVPLAVAPFAGSRGPLRSLALRVAPWAALPALVAALATPAELGLSLPWLFLGANLGLDLIGRIFLLFTSLLWTVSGVYARAFVAEDEDRARFFLFFLLTLSGNLGLIVAQDLATFYVFLTLMTFSAYGLIVHEGGREAIRAGRVYIVLAVMGEAMLLAGGLLAARDAAGLQTVEIAAAVALSTERNLAFALLFLGFGVKAGILPLHIWLPLAHPIAPTPASAVLSGSMIKAGLLGWIRFLPVGEGALPEWGATVIVIGVATTFYGVGVGVLQSNPKTILAYSSISQMGIMAAAVGAGLLDAAVAPAAVAAVLAYALHHSLVKGALFLGQGVASAHSPSPLGRALVLAGLTFTALAMAGAPLTSGSLAKLYLKEMAQLIPGAWAHRVDLFLALAAVGTTLLMARFLQQSFPASAPEDQHRLALGLWVPWLALLLSVAGVLWILPSQYPMGIQPYRLRDAATLWVSIWPVVAGGILFWSAILVARRRQLESRGPTIPKEILSAMARGAEPLRRRAGSWKIRRSTGPVAWLGENWYEVYASRERWSVLLRIESRLTRWSTAGLLFILIGLLVLGMLYAGARQ